MKRFLQDYNDSFEEFKRYNQFFPTPTLRDKNGILTRPGFTISPLIRGLISAKGSIPIMKKFVNGQGISDKESDRVREAIATSLYGTYYFQKNETGELEVNIQLEDFATSRYLSENTEVMVVFITYKDGKHYRYKEAAKIESQSQYGKPLLTFNFPQLQEMPTEKTQLHTYTKTTRDEDINKRFLRLNLLLWNH